MIRPRSIRRPDTDRAAVRTATAIALWLALIPSTPGLADEDAGADDRPEEIVVTGSRIDVGLTGASTTIIDREAIAYSPAQTLPDLLQFEAGVQSRNMFGGTGGAEAVVDLRGFGDTATQNALLLVNGRRLNDIDLAAIDYANIPLPSIDRIEITRGNAAGVLYGDGAVGGVINIVTRTGAPQGNTGSARFTIGPEHYRQGDLSTELSLGSYSLNSYLGLTYGDGYRKNNDIEQRNLITELRRRGETGDLFLKLGIDDQELGLPGGRTVDPAWGLDQLHDDPRGTDNPFDWADQSGISGSLGGTRQLSDAIQLVLDAGIRDKHQEYAYVSYGTFGETDLLTWSITPRLSLDYELSGLDVKSIIGFDYYQTDYDSDRRSGRNRAPYYRHRGEQRTAALYIQNTLTLGADTDVSFGLRGQYLAYQGDDRLDLSEFDGYYCFDTDHDSLHHDELEHAFNLGIEHRVTDQLSVFGRVGRSFRLPTVDERALTVDATSFALETQTSIDAEVGARYTAGPVDLHTSVYGMRLRDEIYYSAAFGAFGANENLDPTRRFGVETSAGLQVTDDLRLMGTLSYTHAEFIDGPFDGEDMPLVSPWTASASAFWDVRPLLGDVFDDLHLATTVHYTDEKQLGDDPSLPRAGKIPGHTLVDAKLTGAWGPITFSLAVYNLFDRDYYDIGYGYGTGRYVYPLPGRTALVSIGTRL